MCIYIYYSIYCILCISYIIDYIYIYIIPPIFSHVICIYICMYNSIYRLHIYIYINTSLHVYIINVQTILHCDKYIHIQVENNESVTPSTKQTVRTRPGLSFLGTSHSTGSSSFSCSL